MSPAYAFRMTDTWTYGSRLREIRENQLRISQEKAAALIRAAGGDASTASYGNWERGSQNPTDESLKAIAAAFGVDPRELGYQPPEGWELVPSSWIAERFDALQADMRRLIEFHRTGERSILQ